MSFRTFLIRCTATLALATSGLAHAATQYVLLTPAPTACADSGCQVQQAKITGNASPEPSATLQAEQHIRQVYAVATESYRLQSVGGAYATEYIQGLYSIQTSPDTYVSMPVAFDEQGRVTELFESDQFRYVRSGIAPEVCAAIHAKGLGAIDCSDGTLVYFANFSSVYTGIGPDGAYLDRYEFVSVSFELTRAQVNAATPEALRLAPEPYQVAGI